jgi:hypothetical protein
MRKRDTYVVNSVHKYRDRRPANLVWKSRPHFLNTIGNDGLLHQTSWFHHPFSVCLDLGILFLHWFSHRHFMFIRFERWEESLDNPSSHNPHTSPCWCSCGADSTAPRSGWSRCSPPSACTSSSTSRDRLTRLNMFRSVMIEKALVGTWDTGFSNFWETILQFLRALWSSWAAHSAYLPLILLDGSKNYNWLLSSCLWPISNVYLSLSDQ